MSCYKAEFRFLDAKTAKLGKLKNEVVSKLKCNCLTCYVINEAQDHGSLLEDEYIRSRLKTSSDDGALRHEIPPTGDGLMILDLIGCIVKYFIKTTSSSDKFIIFVPESCYEEFDNLIFETTSEESTFLLTRSLGKSDFLRFLENIQLWSFGKQYENQLLMQKLMEYYIVKQKSTMVIHLEDFGCKLNIKGFVQNADSETVKYLISLDLIKNKDLETEFFFHHVVYSYTCVPKMFLHQKRIFESLARCAGCNNLKRFFCLKSPEHKELNVVEYACRAQADRMLELILNFENGFKTTTDALVYDVTDLIPDTIATQSREELKENDDGQLKVLTIEPIKSADKYPKVSCLERILASSEQNIGRASKMLLVTPFDRLIEEYVLLSKSIRLILFFIQVIFMVSFTWYNMNFLSDKFAAILHDSCSANVSDQTATPTSCSNLSPLNAAAILWLMWPLVSLIFSIYQFAAVSRLISNCNVSNSYFNSLCRFPWVDLMIFVSLIMWFIVVVFQILLSSYFKIVAVIFIAGWLRAALYISFCSQWHGFVVALQSSLTKYFVSFLFVFSFIYIGFSFALRILLTEHKTTDKPFDIVAFTTLVAVFGMGNLDQMPDEVEETVGKVFFLKLVIISYCSLVAILVLAIIRQPDDQLVIRVGSELFPKLKLRLLTDVAWLMSRRKSRILSEFGEPEIGSFYYSLRDLLGMKMKVLKKVGGLYTLRILIEQASIESLDENCQTIENETLLDEILKLKRGVKKLNKSIQQMAPQVK